MTMLALMRTAEFVKVKMRLFVTGASNMVYCVFIWVSPRNVYSFVESTVSTRMQRLSLSV